MEIIIIYYLFLLVFFIIIYCEIITLPHLRYFARDSAFVPSTAGDQEGSIPAHKQILREFD